MRLDISYGSLNSCSDSNYVLVVMGSILSQFYDYDRVQIRRLTWEREPGVVEFPRARP
jgi:hypothetical protein